MDLVWLPIARSERRAQIAFIASRDPISALEVGQRLRDAIERLTLFPNAGRPARLDGTRELVIGKTYLVAIYRIDEGLREVHILRILHARQKFPAE